MGNNFFIHKQIQKCGAVMKKVFFAISIFALISNFEGKHTLSSFVKRLQITLYNTVNYVLKRVSLGSKDCTKELKLECAYFLGQTS